MIPGTSSSFGAAFADVEVPVDIATRQSQFAQHPDCSGTKEQQRQHQQENINDDWSRGI
jgi:hypothetical protein